jgi:2-dehydropantoate 2-reductase
MAASDPSFTDSVPLRTIAVVGAGAVGSYYGARLVRSSERVSFLLRRDLEAVRRGGLRVATPEEEFRLEHVAAAATAVEIGPVDLVLIALKTTANDALERLVSPLLHEHTAILTLQNGLGSDELLASLFGAQRVLGGLCFICVNRVAPGEIVCTAPGSVSFAEFGRTAGERVRAIAAMFERAGVRTHIGDDLALLRWRKLVWNVPFNGLAVAAGGITTDRILADPALEDEVRLLMREVLAAAAKLGHPIPDDFVESQIAATLPMGAYRPSSLIDYLEGSEVEVEAIWGEPLRRAKAAGADVPHLEALYERIQRRIAERAQPGSPGGKPRWTSPFRSE